MKENTINYSISFIFQCKFMITIFSGIFYNGFYQVYKKFLIITKSSFEPGLFDKIVGNLRQIYNGVTRYIKTLNSPLFFLEGIDLTKLFPMGYERVTTAAMLIM